MSENDLLGFDPLETATEAGGLDKSIAEEAVRREVLNILKSYTGYFDLFSELIQNALDAIDQNHAIPGYNPKIWITIDLVNSHVRVVDNGIGMGLKETKYCFRPNVSFKDRRTSRGHKGVGATFVAYGFSSVRIFTKRDGHSLAGQLRNGRQWAEDTTESYPRPVFETTTLDCPELTTESSGTCVDVIIGPKQRPQLPWLQASSAKQWLDVLRIKSPLGGIYLSAQSRSSKPAIHIQVIDIAGTVTEISGTNVDYYYPHEIPNLKKVATISAIDEALEKIPGDPTTKMQRLPDSYRRLDGVWEVWRKDSILSDPTLSKTLDEDQKAAIERHNIVLYGCFVSSAVSWATFQKDTLRVRATAVLLRGGLQLASDYMPQGDLNVIPLTSDVAPAA